MNSIFLFKLFLSFIVGGLYIALTIRISERIGSRIGGLLIGLPSTLLVSLIFIAWTQNAGAAVSAGETLPAPVYEEWMEKTGKPMLDGIGATEMLHIFITNRFEDHKPACTGKPVTGYEAKVIGPDGADLPPGEIGRLVVRGPTGCRYLRGERQGEYVHDGWNVSGDTFSVDVDGYFPLREW